MSNRNPYHRAASLPELLSWHDEDFVRCAYVSILGRQPDLEGESYFVERVRQGHSRLAILWHLRCSAEGRRHNPGIRGLDRALRLAAWQRKPVIGLLFRLVSSNPDTDSALARYRRARLNAATLERYNLYGISLKLGAIEAVLDRTLYEPKLEAAQKPSRQSSRPPSLAKIPTSLKHLLPSSPLARFFSEAEL
ncbi:MAG TPA: DUF4214 domain-containing protein [Sphingomicrobium sp.]|nr:DUF4214 domain-containing protein [Sphingomicrobium sp.]